MSKYDQDALNELENGVAPGGEGNLPFDVAIWRALNGQSALKSLSATPVNAVYFGGWATGKTETDEYAQSSGKAPLPFGVHEMGELDKVYDAYVTRELFVAPIVSRVSWVKKTGAMPVRSPEYFEGSSRHFQCVGFMGIRSTAETTEIEPWGLVMLTVKGMQVTHVLDGINKWNSSTAPVRRKIAASEGVSNIPAWVFYMKMGTFGQTPNFLKVGKGNNTSIITPISTYIPQQITDELLDKLYVGEGVTAVMVDAKKSAADWAAGWDKASRSAPAPASDEEPSFNETDEIPF